MNIKYQLLNSTAFFVVWAPYVSDVAIVKAIEGLWEKYEEKRKK